MNRLSGSMMNRATKVARFSRKKESQMPNRLSTPVSMILISRPECWAVMEGERQHQHVLEDRSPWRRAAGGAPCGRPAARRRCWRRCRQCRPRPTAPAAPGVAPQDLDRLVARRAQKIDDLAEQHRLVELQRRHRDVGEGQHDRQPALGAQQPDDPTVDAEEFHAACSVTPSGARTAASRPPAIGLMSGPEARGPRSARDDRPCSMPASPRKRSTVRTKKLTPNGIAMSLKS